jgi:hypothetical protein
VIGTGFPPTLVLEIVYRGIRGNDRKDRRGFPTPHGSSLFQKGEDCKKGVRRWIVSVCKCIFGAGMSRLSIINTVINNDRQKHVDFR